MASTSPWLDLNATYGDVVSIWVLVFFWNLVTLAAVHVTTGVVATYNFRAAPHSWAILLVFFLWSLLVAVFIGCVLSLLLAIICNSGSYQLQGFMGLSIGLALTLLYVVISVLHLLPSLA